MYQAITGSGLAMIIYSGNVESFYEATGGADQSENNSSLSKPNGLFRTRQTTNDTEPKNLLKFLNFIETSSSKAESKTDTVMLSKLCER